MTRRHWFARLLASWLVTWGARRARAIAAPASGPSGPAGTRPYYTHNAGNHLGSFATRPGPS
jgi:hypothetical protein